VPLEVHLIDAFADGPFTGNPAAVVLLPGARAEEWMQRVAMEMNQSETAFLLRQEGSFSLRWFTPNKEVDLCGHATLASAHYLWEGGHLDANAVARFHTRSGWLTARRAGDGWITLNFPAITSHRTEAPPDLAAVLGAEPQHVRRGDFDLLCVMKDAATVRTLQPNLTAMAHWEVRGVLVTASGDTDGIDFVSRCFFPAYGVPEDPVTGSAHCTLAMYWRHVLGHDEMVGFQASARSGTVRCAVVGDRVELTGRAVTTLTGELLA
jgi:PhzF family phenazine biosynthesis protein